MPQSSASDRFPSRRFSSLARRRHALRRAFFFSALSIPIALPAGSAWGEDCASVPETERAVCELQARCDALEDAERRQECLAAADTLRQTLRPETLETETPPAAEAPAPAAAPEPEGKAEPRRGLWGRVTGLLKRDEPASSASDPPPATADESAPAITEVKVTKTTVDRTVLEIPEHFFGEVTAHRKLVRDRQLIAVDNRVLFEGDVWRESKIRQGNRVEVQKVSSLFGERYRILGPSKRAVTANRIRCERVELNTDDRRKCSLLPDG